MSHTVLVVDDEPDVRTFLIAVLKKRGYETLSAADGREAFEVLQREKPDLVILDVVMPRRSGFTVLERLHLMPTVNPRIIMVTGNANPQHQQFAESRGVDAFIAKPFDIETVLDLVDSLLKVQTTS